MQWMQSDINECCQQELLSQRNFLQLLELTRELSLCEESNVSVQLVEEKDMGASHTVALVEPSHALLVDPLEGLKIRSIHWRFVRQRQTYRNDVRYTCSLFKDRF